MRTAVALCALVLAVAAQAQGPVWRDAQGPFTGAVLLQHPTGPILGRAGDALYRSDDDGVTWSYWATPPPSFSGPFLLPGGDLLGAGGGRLIRSGDLGLAWSPAAPDSIPGSNIAVGPAGEWYTATQNLLYFSPDEGASWTTHALPSTPVYGGSVLAVSGTGVVFVARCGTPACTVYRSFDHGATWTQVLGGVGGTSLRRLNDGKVLGISRELNLFTTPGAFRIEADGSHTTWLRWNEQVASALVRASGALVISHVEGLHDWSGPDLPVAAPHLMETQAGTLLANAGGHCFPALDPPITCLTGDGVYRLPEGESRWIQTGVRAEAVSALAVRGDTLFVGSGSGLHSPRAGAWEPAGWLYGGVNDLLLLVGGRLLVASDEVGLTTYPYDYTSTPCSQLCEVAAVEETAGGAVLAAVTRRLYGSHVGITRAASLEGEWTHALGGVGNVRALSAGADGFVLAGTHGQAWQGPPGVGVYRSLDDGASWTAAVSGLTDTEVHSVLAATGASYAGTEAGVFRSLDQGATWAFDGLAGTTVHALALSSAGALAGTDAGLFVRTGAGWQPYGSGLGGRTVLTILVHSEGEGEFIALGTDRGVFADRVLVTVDAAPGPPPEAPTLALSAPRPNPVVGSAEITFTLPGPAEARLTVRDVLGREVAEVAAGPRAAGRHVVSVSVAGLPAGVYLLQLDSGGRVLTRSLTVVR